MNWSLQKSNNFSKGNRGASFWGLDFKMKPKMQTWVSLTGFSKGYSTQVAIKACGPLYMKT